MEVVDYEGKGGGIATLCGVGSMWFYEANKKSHRSRDLGDWRSKVEVYGSVW